MTQDAAQPRRGAGISVAAWPLRRKMALALAIPLLLAAVLGGLRVTGDLVDSRQAASSAKQVTIIQPAIDYLTASESAMVAAQSDSAASQGDLIDAIDDITTNAETLVQARGTADLNDVQIAHVDALLDLSQAMRGEGAENLGPATWIALVRQLESSVSQLITSVNAAQETPEPRLEQLSQTMSGRLSLALQQGLIATALSQSSSQELFSEIGVEAAAIDRLAGSVAGAEDQTALLRTQNTRHAGQIRDDAATNLDGRDAYAPYDEITATLVSGVTKTLDEAASDAQRNALVGAVLTLLALAAAVFLALFVARSLLEPIGKVREGALAVARHRLPDAVARIRAGQEPEPIKTIDVTTNEEIGQVARAVDDLHRQAIHLASGEAQLRQTVNAMFVTLSRRSTSLVNQQLAQIERLEHDEEDPKRLESLFRLDHLASRMRRTADSLLILADAPNRAAGQFSLTVGEALQAATSGVQDYQRVQILSHLSTRVGDEAAADVVHLLTELVDNALTYSPPAEPVRLAAKLGADGVTITVTDSGLGVPPAELEQLNSDLQHGAEATPDTARRMGLFVVSRLAERHGIEARLARNPGGGMTASVLLPPSVLPSSRRWPPRLPRPRPLRSPPRAAAAAVDTTAVAAHADSKRESRGRSRSEKAQAKAAEKAQAKASAAEAKAAAAETEAAPAAPAAAAASPAATEGRPPLESLLPRREPGANIPRTGADAFLPPETSGATGPLFGKRAEPAAEDAPARPTPRPPGPPRPSRRPRRRARPRRSPPSCRSPRWPRASVPRPSRRPAPPSRSPSPSPSPSPRRWPSPSPSSRPSPSRRSRSAPTTRCPTRCPTRWRATPPARRSRSRSRPRPSPRLSPSPRSHPSRRPRSSPSPSARQRHSARTSRSTSTTRWASVVPAAPRPPRSSPWPSPSPSPSPSLPVAGLVGARSRPSRPPSPSRSRPLRHSPPTTAARRRPTAWRTTARRATGSRATAARPVPGETPRSSSRCARAGSPARARASSTRPRSTAAGRSPSTSPRRCPSRSRPSPDFPDVPPGSASSRVA